MTKKLRGQFKSAFAVLAFLILIAAAFTARTEAADTYVQIGGFALYADDTWHSWNEGKPEISGWTAGRYKLSRDMGTLYLDGFKHSDQEYGSLSTNCSLTIVVTGANSLTSISLDAGDKSLDLTGSGDGASLLVTNTVDVKDCTITSAELTVSYPDATVSYLGSLWCSGDLTLNSGSVLAKNLNAFTCQVKSGTLGAYRNFSVNDSSRTSVISGGIVFADNGFGFQGPVELKGGNVYIYSGNAYFHKGLTQTGGALLTTSGDVVLSKGDYTGSGGLLQSVGAINVRDGNMRLTGAAVSARDGIVSVSSESNGGDIYISSGSLTSNKSGINVSGNVEIVSNGKITTTLARDVDQSITRANAALFVGGSLNAVNGGELIAKSERQHYKALEVSSKTTISGGKVTAELTKSDNGSYAAWLTGDVYLQREGSFVAKGAANYSAVGCAAGLSINNSVMTVTGDNSGSGLYVGGTFDLLSGNFTASSGSDAFIAENVMIRGGTAAVNTDQGKALEANTLRMTGGKLTLNGGYSAWRIYESLDLADDIWISEPSDGTISDGQYRGINNENGELSKTAVLQKASSISVQSLPRRELYSGEALIPYGLVLNVRFDDGSAAALSYNNHESMFDFDPALTQPLSTGTQSIGVTCLTKETSFNYTTKELGVPQISLTDVTYDSIGLSWDAVTDATAYKVYRTDTKQGETSMFDVTDTSFTDTDLVTGRKYSYSVKAAIPDKGVISAASNVVEAAPKFIGSTTLEIASSGQSELSWSATDGATGYEIWRGTGAGGTPELLATVDADTTAYTDASADIYTVYNYTVTPLRVTEDGTFYGDESDAAVSTAQKKPAPQIVPPSREEPENTEFNLLQARSGKVAKNSIQIKWKKVPGAKKYVIYGNKCGTKYKYKKLTTTAKTAFSYKKVAGKKVTKGTYFKFIVYAVDAKGNIISTSKTVHVATKGGKVGNDKSVKTAAKKNKVALKRGQRFRLKAKAVPDSKKLKVRRHRGMAYESSNPKVAKISNKGVIKAVGKGTCHVYAYTQNGVFAKVKVTVK